MAAGSLNRDGVLVLRALRPAEESTPARIARLTLDAQVGAGWLQSGRSCFWEALPMTSCQLGRGCLQTAAACCCSVIACVVHRPAHPCQPLAALTCLVNHHYRLQAKRPQLRTWLVRFGEVYSKAVVAAAVALLAGLLATGVPLLGAAGQVRWGGQAVQWVGRTAVNLPWLSCTEQAYPPRLPPHA